MYVILYIYKLQYRTVIGGPYTVGKTATAADLSGSTQQEERSCGVQDLNPGRWDAVQDNAPTTRGHRPLDPRLAAG